MHHSKHFKNAALEILKSCWQIVRRFELIPVCTTMTNMKLEGLSIIGSNRVPPAGKQTQALNPATGAALEPGYFWATANDVEQAAQLASVAFVEYKRWPAKRRADL